METGAIVLLELFITGLRVNLALIKNVSIAIKELAIYVNKAFILP
jgi:hypothetical protein